MGTNYYYKFRPPCKKCKREWPGLHIGKSSAGWCFALHIYPDGIDEDCGFGRLKITNLDEWEDLLVLNSPEGQIYDEYGDRITKEEMLNTIINRARPIQWQKAPDMYSSWAEFHQQNHSEQGPKGLLRHKIDGNHCIGHGEGTWDLLVGEFS